MVSLEGELKYLENIKIDASFDEIICNKIKEYVYKVVDAQSTSEIYDIYEHISDLVHISYPRIEYNIENKIEEDLQALKTKFIVCSIDRILSTKQSY